MSRSDRNHNPPHPPHLRPTPTSRLGAQLAALPSATTATATATATDTDDTDTPLAVWKERAEAALEVLLRRPQQEGVMVAPPPEGFSFSGSVTASSSSSSVRWLLQRCLLDDDHNHPSKWWLLWLLRRLLLFSASDDDADLAAVTSILQYLRRVLFSGRRHVHVMHDHDDDVHLYWLTFRLYYDHHHHHGHHHFHHPHRSRAALLLLSAVLRRHTFTTHAAVDHDLEDPTLAWLRPYLVLNHHHHQQQQQHKKETTTMQDKDKEEEVTEGVVPRAVVARNVWIHARWFQHLLRLSQHMVHDLDKVFDKEVRTDNNTDHSLLHLHLLNAFLSWSVQIVVQALVYGASTPPSPHDMTTTTTTTTCELRVRSLLPVLYQAVASTSTSDSEDYPHLTNTPTTLWRLWGYLVASTLHEHFPMDRILESLCEHILQGMTTMMKRRLDKHNDKDHPPVHDDDDLDPQVSLALATLLSLLLPTPHTPTAYPPNPTTTYPEEEEDSEENHSFLLEWLPPPPPLLSTTTTPTPKHPQMMQPQIWVGCPRMTARIYDGLTLNTSSSSSSSTSLSSSSSSSSFMRLLCRHLTALHVEQAVMVMPLLASLCVEAVRRQHPFVLEALWSHIPGPVWHAPTTVTPFVFLFVQQMPPYQGWIASLACHIVLRDPPQPPPQPLSQKGNDAAPSSSSSSLSLSPFSSSSSSASDPSTFLARLHAMDARETERGVAHAWDRLRRDPSSSSSSLSLSLLSSHPNPQSSTSSLSLLLLQRWSVERNASVALAVGDALWQRLLLKKKKKKRTKKIRVDDDDDDDDDHVSDDWMSIDAARYIGRGFELWIAQQYQYQYPQQGNGKVSDVKALVSSVLVRAIHVTSALLRRRFWRMEEIGGDVRDDHYHSLWILLISFLDHAQTKDLRKAAARGIGSILGDPPSIHTDGDANVDANATLTTSNAKKRRSKTDRLVTRAQSSMARNERFLAGFFQQNASVTNSIRRLESRSRTSLWIVLEAIANACSYDKSTWSHDHGDDERYRLTGLTIQELFHLCLDLTGSSSLPRRHCRTLQILLAFCLDSTTERQEVISRIVALASVPVERVYYVVSQPVLVLAVSSVLDAQQDVAVVSPMAILLEAGAQPTTKSYATARLLTIAAEWMSEEKEGVVEEEEVEVEEEVEKVDDDDEEEEDVKEANGQGKESEEKDVDEFDNLILGIAFCLVMLSHTDRHVRLKAARLLRRCKTSSHCLVPQWSPLFILPSCIAKYENSAHLGGDNFLADFLLDCGKLAEGKQNAFSLAIMKLCVVCATSLPKVPKTIRVGMFDDSISSMKNERAAGSCSAAAVLLDAMEKAGNELFPLERLWTEVGEVILRRILHSCSESPPQPLSDVLIRMMKGEEVSHPQIFISVGHSHSGNGDTIHFIDPYPESMIALLVEILRSNKRDSCGTAMAELVVRIVLGSESWRDVIFPKLKHEHRVEVASSYLIFLEDPEHHTSDGIFFGLPLTPPDVNGLLERNNESSILFISYFIRSNASIFRNNRESCRTVELLFHILNDIKHGTNMTEQTENSAFIEQSILVAISELLAVNDGNSYVRIGIKAARVYAQSLIASFTTPKSSIRFGTFRSRSAAFSVLTSLSNTSPKAVVPQLLPLLRATVTPENVKDVQDVEIALKCIIPLVARHGATENVMLSDLFIAMMNETQRGSTHLRLTVFGCLVDVLTSSCDETGLASSGNLLSAFAATYLAKHLSEDVPGADALVVLSSYIDVLDPTVLLSCSLLLVKYALGLTIELVDESLNTELMDSGIFKGLVSPSDLVRIVAGNHENVPSLASILMEVCSRIFLLDKVQKCMEKANDEESILILALWQNILVTETVLKSLGVESVVASAGETRHTIQNVLPVHLFLASMNDFLHETATNDVRETALILLAERVVEVAADSLESKLFLDLVPCIVELLSDESHSTASASPMRQAALLALEHIARVVHCEERKSPDPFVGALEVSTKLLHGFTGISNLFDLEVADRQLICSAALTCSTLISAAKTQCSDSISKAFQYCVALLRGLNRFSDAGKVAPVIKADARILQLSLLRALRSILVAVPQFLPSYLPHLLSHGTLYCRSLREIDRKNVNNPSEVSIREEIAALDRVISQIPCRVLIPSVSHALAIATVSRSESLLGECNDDEERRNHSDTSALIRVCSQSIEQASFGEAASQRQRVLDLVIWVASGVGDDDDDDDDSIRDDATRLLLALVLKLSESQLRQLYQNLYAWWQKQRVSGLVDPGASTTTVSALSTAATSSTANVVFWSLTRSLCRELLTLFLPCLSLVWDDAISVLSDCLDMMSGDCTSGKSGAERSLKRRRRRHHHRHVDDDDDSNIDSGDAAVHRPMSGAHVASRAAALKTSEIVLQCLEYALRSDARNGGDWTRAESSKRFHRVLPVLARCLRLPSVSSGSSSSRSSSINSITKNDDVQANTATDVSSSLFQKTLRSVFVALASCAGTEDLWKPLNHVILQACRLDASVWVGLQTLLDVMQCVGEEYMVLIPECLPTLSERLEDINEEIASLARECVRVAEDLLGESLEDNL